MTNEDKRMSREEKTLKLIKKYLLEFDVQNSSGQDARNLIAWLQMEIKISDRKVSENPD